MEHHTKQKQNNFKTVASTNEVRVWSLTDNTNPEQYFQKIRHIRNANELVSHFLF